MESYNPFTHVFFSNLSPISGDFEPEIWFLCLNELILCLFIFNEPVVDQLLLIFSIYIVLYSYYAQSSLRCESLGATEA